jgi:hypothetical protein
MALILYPPRQIAAAVESSEGSQVSAGSITAADLIQVLDPTVQVTPNTFPRELARRGFGTVPNFYSTGTATLTFGVELTGSTDNASSWTAVPKWSKLLNACGLGTTELGYLGLSGSITGGPIQDGETLTAGATAVAYGYTYNGATIAYVVKAASALTAGSGSGGTSSASFTVAGTGPQLGNVLSGYGWRPLTEDASNATLTFHFRIDGQRYQIYGARGNVAIQFETHNRVTLQFTFQGIFDELDASANLSELGATAFKAMPPAAFLNASSTLTPRGTDGTEGTAISGGDLCWSTGTLDLGNTVTVRPCANGVNGYLAAVISERRPTFTINPDDPGVAAYPYIQKLMEGSRARFRCSWGATAGNRWIVQIPHLQAQSSSMGERDNRANHTLTFDCTLGENDGAADTAVGYDNEFQLINF